jgi:hypothetical protein
MVFFSVFELVFHFSTKPPDFNTVAANFSPTVNPTPHGHRNQTIIEKGPIY